MKSDNEEVAASLCLKYGLRLGEGQLVPKRHVGVYNPVAELLSRRFEVSDDVGKIDRSKGMRKKFLDKILNEKGTIGTIEWWTQGSIVRKPKAHFHIIVVSET